MSEHQQSPEPDDTGGREVEEMEIKSLAALKEIHPNLLEEFKNEVLESLKAGQELKDLKEQLESANSAKEDAEKKLTESQDENTKLKGQIAESERKELVDTKLTEQKVDPKSVTKAFRKALVEAKDEAEIDELIKEHVEKWGEVRKASGNPAPRPQTTNPSNGGGNVAEAVKDENASRLFTQPAGVL